jgi:hypothetical protein
VDPVRITRVEVVPENLHVGDELTIVAHVQRDGALQVQAPEVRFLLKSSTEEFFPGVLPITWQNGVDGMASLDWKEFPHSLGPYQILCSAAWQTPNGDLKQGPPVAAPRLLQILPKPPDDHLPAEAVARPRGARSTIPYRVTNLAGAESFGLTFDLQETGYPLVEFGPKRPDVQDPNAPLAEGPAKAFYAAAIAAVYPHVRPAASNLVDVESHTGLPRRNHIFSVVHHRSADDSAYDGNYGLVTADQQRKAAELVTAATRRVITDRQGQEEQTSLLRDAIELDPNNLRAYLEIVRVWVLESLDKDFIRGRKYYLNLFFRLLSAVAYLEPLLKHGEPERQSAFRIWAEVGVYAANLMKWVTQVRGAYTNYPTIGFIEEFRSLADTLGLRSLLPLDYLSADVLNWLHYPPQTEPMRREELVLLVPNLQYLPLSDYFRRRFLGFNPNSVLYHERGMQRWLWNSLQEQFKPVKYNSADPRHAVLLQWIDYVGAPPADAV